MRAIPFVDESRRLTQNDSTQNEVIFHPFTYYESLGSPSYNVVGFRCKSNNMLKYKKWFRTDNAIFCKPFIKKYLRC